VEDGEQESETAAAHPEEPLQVEIVRSALLHGAGEGTTHLEGDDGHTEEGEHEEGEGILSSNESGFIWEERANERQAVSQSRQDCE